MATPHVAGVAALVKGNNSSLSAASVTANFACDVSTDGTQRSESEFDAGLLNALDAVTNGASANPYAGLTVEVTPNAGELTVTEFGTFNIANLP